MRPLTLVLLPAVLAAPLLQHRQATTRPDPQAAARHEAAALFRSRCADCHVVPDPAFAYDRVWLDQVRRTA